MGIFQVLRFEFQKFRILDILNFHPCMFKLMDKKIFTIYNLGERSDSVGLGIEGLLVRVSLPAESLCFDLKEDTLSTA